MVLERIKPYFQPPVIREFEALDKSYTLRSLDDSYKPSKNDIGTIVSACNEELIYRFLFRSGLHGRKYSHKDAAEFVKWSQKGWRDGNHFVFLVLKADSSPVGCIDISSDDIEHAPIGYWKTVRVKGIMPYVVNELLDIATKAGYKKLYAVVEPGNVRSSNLLKRTGFNLLGIRSMEMRFMGKPTGECKLFKIYEHVLDW
jgi:RimJ/RimL family protein N-acetyltransferase